MAPRPPECTDCIAEAQPRWRPVEQISPRVLLCVTHKRARKKARSHRAHALRIEKTYGLTETEYWELYAAQGGKCYVCQRAKGIAKRLCVDHDHKVAVEECGHDAEIGCKHCIRGLACGQCNTDILGRYKPAALMRAIIMQVDPPAQRFWRGEELSELRELTNG